MIYSKIAGGFTTPPPPPPTPPPPTTPTTTNYPAAKFTSQAHLNSCLIP